MFVFVDLNNKNRQSTHVSCLFTKKESANFYGVTRQLAAIDYKILRPYSFAPLSFDKFANRTLNI